MSALCVSVCVCVWRLVFTPAQRGYWGLLPAKPSQARPGRAALPLLLLLLLPLTCRRSNKMFVDVVDAWLWIYDTLVIAVVSFR